MLQHSVNFVKPQPFQNSILIIAFNYSNTLKNKDKLIDMYKNYFKDIIVYSNYPVAKILIK